MLKDLKGNIIDQRTKDSNPVEIDGTSLFTGHRFLLNTRLYGDKRCIYCGKWFHWKDTDMFEWLRTNNIDDMNVDKALEPLHCNSHHCQDYHHQYLEAVAARKEQTIEEMEQRSLRLFKQLKKDGRAS
jgi:hypothetical protein